MSNPILPYDPGDTQSVPAAVARISDVTCMRSGGGYVFTFTVEVFGTSWSPVYKINLAETSEPVIRPAGCPAGWSFAIDMPYLVAFAPVSFGTTSDPIPPGGNLRGFAVSSQTSPVEFRWFAAKLDGTLIGKVTRERFECPLATDESTWGSIKAMYR